ncbi:MAG: YIP1 family protein [Lachnospiraceae bacterium]|nr:YIP1 family protein [Lachnospiraceae bacterium]
MKNLFSKEKWKYLFYCLSHPSDGFYEVRHRERGSVAIAWVMVLLFGISYTINRLCASFIVNDVDPRSVDTLTEIEGVLILVLLLSVSNWSVTCLMNGEGRLKDIMTIIGYSLTPCVLVYVPATLISHFVAQNEEAFYTLLMGVAMAYSLILMLVGIMIVHNYTLGKTLLTILLTFFAMLVIIFVVMMIYSLIGQVFTFFRSIYLELYFR